MTTKFAGPAFVILIATSAVTFAASPQITPATSLQNKAVDVGTNDSFTVVATGDEPLSYQWRFNGADMPGQNNPTLNFANVQPIDEGDYTVVVTNLFGAVTSAPVRLWVVPRASAYLYGNYTNNAGTRLPYFALLPLSYDPGRSYPLFVMFHGYPGDETMMTNANPGGAGYLNYPGLKTFSSFRQQAIDPTIIVWPVRRAGDTSWTDEYLQLTSELLDAFIAEFAVDTNRIYVAGGSGGGHAAWDLVGMRPSFFAGASIAAGTPGKISAASLKDVPVWAWCAADDPTVNVSNSRTLVRRLRVAGGNVTYTEYNSGGHMDGIIMGLCNPVYVDWLLAQRRGISSTREPRLVITTPTSSNFYRAGALTLALAGTAGARGRPVTNVVWENTANASAGAAAGDANWTTPDIPLGEQTNVVIVTATTTSWAPAFGGTTTFNDALTVVPGPLTVTCAPDPVAFDCEFSYALRLNNYTEQAATGVVVTNLLAPQTRFVAVTTTQGSCTLSDGIVTCDIGSLAVHATATITIVVEAAGLGDLINVAGLTANEAEFRPARAITNVVSARMIAAQPVSQIVRTGSNVTFSVRGPCSPQTLYQWQHNGVPVSGATAATLVLTNVQVADEGSYAVLVTHPTGSVLSDPATLVVHVRPTALQPPLSQSVVVGGSVTFSVAIEGNPPPFTYRWRHGAAQVGYECANDRTCFLTLTNIQSSDAGQYRLTVTNGVFPGSALIADFTLNVLPDTNHNRLPDSWEAANGITDPEGDADGDGFSNWQEYVADTCPTNAGNCLRIDGGVLQNNVHLQFDAVSNKTYAVQTCFDLGDSSWHSLTNIVARATNRTVHVEEPSVGAFPVRFYRVVTPRQP